LLPIQLAVGLQLFASWTRLPAKVPGELNLAEAIRSLREVVPEDTIVCNGAGNYASWAHRFYRYERFGTQFAPTSGSMGYGIPAAVAAKRIYPEKTVIAFAGGGCFLMNGQEFATAVQYELPIAVISRITVCMERSGCIRNANIRDASSRRSSVTRISSGMRSASAGMASGWSARGISRPRSRAQSPRANPRFCIA